MDVGMNTGHLKKKWETVESRTISKYIQCFILQIITPENH